VLYQYILRILASISITIATATYLWGYETETICKAPFNGNDW